MEGKADERESREYRTEGEKGRSRGGEEWDEGRREWVNAEIAEEERGLDG